LRLFLPLRQLIENVVYRKTRDYRKLPTVCISYDGRNNESSSLCPRRRVAPAGPAAVETFRIILFTPNYLRRYRERESDTSAGDLRNTRHREYVNGVVTNTFVYAVAARWNFIIVVTLFTRYYPFDGASFFLSPIPKLF